MSEQIIFLPPGESRFIHRPEEGARFIPHREVTAATAVPGTAVSFSMISQTSRAS
jgi:hypothetical protein